MTEFFAGALAFGMGILFSWWVLVLAFCGCLWCEHKDNGGLAIFWALVFGLAAYGVFGLTWGAVWPYLVAYIPVGFVWSFWRWKRYVDDIAEKFVTDVATGELWTGKYKQNQVRAADQAKSMIDLTNNIHKVVYWIIMWPFSFLEQFVGDIIDGIERVVIGIADATYNKLSAKAASKIDAVTKNNTD